MLTRACFSVISRFLLASTILLLAISCSDRSIDNPLDPDNNETFGRPAGVTVTSELDRISLRWEPLPIRDLTSMKIYRKLHGEENFTVIATVPPGTNSYVDISNRFGLLHAYRVSAEVGRYESPMSAEVVITPGPTVSWVTDIDDAAVVKLTHDGRQALVRSRLVSRPTMLAVDRHRQNVWVLDQSFGEVALLNFGGELRQFLRGFPQAADIALDPNSGALWLMDNYLHELRQYLPDGSLLIQVDSLPRIAALAFHERNNELWALLESTTSLMRFRVVGSSVSHTQVELLSNVRPYEIAIHQQSGNGWIAAGDRVYLIDEQASNLTAATHLFDQARRLVVNQMTGECWAIDFSDCFAGKDSRIVKLSATGQTQLLVGGFRCPQGLAVAPFDSSCLVTDTFRGRIVKISNDGTATAVFDRLLTPVAIETVDLTQ